ncbi:hypothetical protein Mapa_008812 [Marchantia paleacea]|nr:hypothetical protein Mapa_008812 [Marchantia paleacea]
MAISFGRSSDESASGSSGRTPAASAVLATHSLNGSSLRSNLKIPANTPPRKATGSCM